MRTPEDQLAHDMHAIMLTGSKEDVYQNGFNDGANEAYAEGRKDAIEELVHMTQDDFVDLAQDWAAPNFQFVFLNALELELFARRVIAARIGTA